ncbi:MAG: hypothetical protein AABW72_04680 [archaeon]|mgnify:CR=1 FL=1
MIRIFEKPLKEYILPIKYYFIACILVVISQYAIVLPLNDKYPILVNISQWLWELAVALALSYQIIKNNFNLKQVLFNGALFAIAIHGLKITIRFLFYGKDINYMIDRFTYGSLLVMAVTIGTWMIISYVTKKKII